MNIQLDFNQKQRQIFEKITISGSKSESNRLLILQKLFPEISIENLSDSDDSIHMQYALSTEIELVDIGHAGTAMRFLTSYFATTEGKKVILTGSERMQNRPIKILVDALQDLGAKITYEDKIGYPPLRILGTKITKEKVQIHGNVSSQYISSLLLIASKLEKGLTIELLGEITSIPYIEMTLSLLHQLGIETKFEGNFIQVFPKKAIEKHLIVVESDWSSASYFYSIVALSEIGSEISLTAYKKNSLQGDSCLAKIYQHFGVETVFQDNSITLKKVKESSSTVLEIDLKNAPDIAQTIAVTCFAEGIACNLSGLHTLKIKETDRLEALHDELTKLGATISVSDKSLHLEKSSNIHKNIKIKTYNDHRMAMAFAPLALKVPIKILNAEVVTKSYQKFWDDMQQVGIEVDELV
ncbi:MAG: 3-phosphoshikimate 1-carboxyvinyltransferase [Flavobacteriia bacterium]|nr:3-phosphoshikimate 1-carboxyvinyltransferase [Flavobacteriia bacterium]OIP47050.1 MAG: 3-phosphoshikimate 1-carboxyvinyltransferase [Flavobacteriaceae bacterium CG2_30_31_66]PIV97781.1 MAG: 3-phosphoshikimate 1-carboxyvinyltransferase [Flavobacteriaceae bacterium CG17_big_fil_post_rev_8_21_14_2_50_31_13]PIX12787.1 MAG: 3-phosphoshikimate 1-carboxyvinyltransferase [Flavobacteriaceae bacterium CG_4_8_14_3_um_filter_31_8]PIY14518.1 MAG: 3-phosphoshikimate 1-carboxyvinyltransferase [Flavobacteri